MQSLALPADPGGRDPERRGHLASDIPEMPPRPAGLPHVMLMHVGAGPGESAVHAAKLKTERERHAKVAVELVASASPRESANARRISAGRYPSPPFPRCAGTGRGYCAPAPSSLQELQSFTEIRREKLRPLSCASWTRSWVTRRR